MLSTILDYIGGEREIRTLDTCFSTYAPLAGEYLRPLGQLTLNFNLAQHAECKELSLDHHTVVQKVFLLLAVYPQRFFSFLRLVVFLQLFHTLA